MSKWNPFHPDYAVRNGILVFVISLAAIWGLGEYLRS